MSEILYLTCRFCGKVVETDAEHFEDMGLHPNDVDVECRECAGVSEDDE